MVSWAPRPTPASRRSRRLSLPPSRFKLSLCNYSFSSFDVCLTGSFSNRSARISKIMSCYGKQRGVEGFDDLLTANSFSFRWVRKSPLALFGSCSNKKRHIFLSRTPMAPCTNFSADTHECISLPVQSIDGLCSPIRTRHSCRLLCICSICI